MKKIIQLFAFAFIFASASAAVPLHWTVETSRATPATFEAYQGETLAFEAALQSYGKPLEAPSSYSLYWQTNGMGSTYWSVPCIQTFEQSEHSNILYATWSPTNDVGARVYNCFIGQPGTIYHAAFQLRLRPSPGALPNVLPLPVPVIDFAKVRVLNPPWEGGGGGGVDTNEVERIANMAVETNAVTVGLSSSVSNRYTKAEADAKLAGKHPLNGELNILNGSAFYGASGVRFGTDGGRYFFSSSGDAEFHDVYVVGLEGISVARLQFGSYEDIEALERSDWNFIRAGSYDSGWHYLWDDMTNEVRKAKYTPSATDTAFSNAVDTIVRSIMPTKLRAYDPVRQCWWNIQPVNGVLTLTVED